MKHQVAVLALDGVAPFDLGTPSQILGAARSVSGHEGGERPGMPGATGRRGALPEPGR